MPERNPLGRFTWERGYYPNTAILTGVPNCLLGGQNLWHRGAGRMVVSRGFGGSVASSGGANPLMNVGLGYGGLSGGGSVAQAFGSGIYFFAGSGTLYINGVAHGTVLGGSVTIWTGSGAVAAGLLPPGAAVIADTGASGHNNGAYSIALTTRRSITGAESSLGPPSNVISVENHGVKINSVTSIPSGADQLGIYVTKRGFGSIGPYFHLYDVAIPSFPYVIQVPGDATPGWIDAQLGDIGPTDYNVPPACTFVLVINAVVVAAGCYGGAGMSPSHPNKPEAYPVRFVVFVPGGGTVTAVVGAGVEGAALLCTASSINLVTASQSTISPIKIDPIWLATGVTSGNQITGLGGEIWAYIGQRGAVRGSINSDLSDDAGDFALPVHKFFETNGYGDGTEVVRYDPKNDCMWYVHGTVGISYNRSGTWNTPHTMPASIVTGVTDTANKRVLFADGAGNLYTPENGSGTTWSLVTQMQGNSYPHTILGERAMTNVACRMDVYTDLDIVTPDPLGTNISVNSGHGDFEVDNIPLSKSFGIGLSGTNSGGQELYGADLLVNEHPVRV